MRSGRSTGVQANGEAHAAYESCSIANVARCFGLRFAVLAHFRRLGLIRRSELGGSECAFAPFWSHVSWLL
jgi:hypothetical protein